MATKMTKEEAVALLERYSNYDGMGIPNLAGCKEAMKVAVDALKEAFPELAESEDERIMSRIIDGFKNFSRSASKWNNIPIEEVIAYLEKQKECVSNNFDDVWNEEDCEDIIAEGQKLTPRFKELLKEVCHAWYDRGAKFEKQQEQKTAEVDESTKRLNDNWIKQHFDDYKEQKPAEWSEEGKRKLNRIYEIIGQAADEQPFGSSKRIIGDKEAVELQDFIKSLRPSWKPSEEQMDALHQCVVYLHGEGSLYFEPIKSLYEQLKKL